MADPRRDERLLFRRFANRSHASGAHGGQLFVTNVGITFRPHWFDRLVVKAPTVAIPWTEVAEVEVAARVKGDRRQGGLRRRLRILRTNGTAELFIVNRVEWVKDRIQEIQRSLAGH